VKAQLVLESVRVDRDTHPNPTLQVNSSIEVLTFEARRAPPSLPGFCGAGAPPSASPTPPTARRSAPPRCAAAGPLPRPLAGGCDYEWVELYRQLARKRALDTAVTLT
jgi:hypothetical protein